MSQRSRRAAAAVGTGLPAGRRVRRVLGGLLVLAVVLPAVAGSGFWFWMRTSLPLVEGTIDLPGLHQPVEIVRDGNAVPHIFAAESHDAWFSLGFLHAQDRLWQMDVQRRAGSGRLSELFGARTVKL